MVIAKMNRGFHKHGKYLFPLLTVLIIIAFIGMFSGLDRTILSDRNTREQVFGLAFGSEVTISEIEKQIKYNQLNFALKSGIIPGPMNFSDQILKSGFNLVLLSRAVDELGVSASEKQVAQQIINTRELRNKNKFDSEAFGKFLKKLDQSGYSESELNNAVQQKLTQEALDETIVNPQNSILTNSELKAFYLVRNQTYKGILIKFDSKKYQNDIKIDKNDLEKKYNLLKNKYLKTLGNIERLRTELSSADTPAKQENILKKINRNTALIKKIKKQNMIVPEKYKYKYVRFNIDDYASDAAEKVTEEKISEFYRKNKSSYTEEGKLIPLKQVKEKIKNKITADYKLKIAQSAAQNFSDNAFTMIDDTKGLAEKEKAFLKLSHSKGLKVISSNWLSLAPSDENEKRNDRAKLFNALSNVYKEIPVSDPVVLQNHVIIAYLTDRKKAQFGSFDELENSVRKLLIKKKAMALTEKAAGETLQNIKKFLSKGKNLKKYKSSLANSENFSLKTKEMKLKNFEYGFDFFNKLTSLNVNSVSGLIPVKDGFTVLYLDEKNLPDMKNFSRLKILNEYRRVKILNNTNIFTYYLRENSS